MNGVLKWKALYSECLTYSVCYQFIELFLAPLCLCCCTWAFCSFGGLSLRRLLLLWSLSGHTGFRTVACGLYCLGSVTGSRAGLSCSIRKLPRPGIEPVSPALTGGFLTIGPPGKSLLVVFLISSVQSLSRVRLFATP